MNSILHMLQGPSTRHLFNDTAFLNVELTMFKGGISFLSKTVTLFIPGISQDEKANPKLTRALLGEYLFG